jgi:hypothetical protein
MCKLIIKSISKLKGSKFVSLSFKGFVGAHITFFLLLCFLIYVHCASCVCKFSQVVIGYIFHFRVVFWVWEKTMHYIRFKVHSMMSLLSFLKTFRFR